MKRTPRSISGRRTHAPIAAFLLALLALAPAPSAAQDEAATPTLTLERIQIEPGDPSVDTLCRLTVTLKNHGEENASQLGFSVKINGQELAVYGNQLFMYPVAPGETADIPLYNFWTTETSRPAPADGKLEVEVSLLEAQWMQIGTETEDGEEIEVWQPLGAIEGLPVSNSVTLTLK